MTPPLTDEQRADILDPENERIAHELAVQEYKDIQEWIKKMEYPFKWNPTPNTPK